MVGTIGHLKKVVNLYGYLRMHLYVKHNLYLTLYVMVMLKHLVIKSITFNAQ